MACHPGARACVQLTDTCKDILSPPATINMVASCPIMKLSLDGDVLYVLWPTLALALVLR